jgi:hypothetical protein
MPRLDGACHLLRCLNEVHHIEIHDIMNRPDRSVLLDLLNDKIDDIYTCYAALRREAGVVRDASSALLVTRHRTVVETIADPQFAFVGQHAFSSAGPELRARIAATGYFDLLMFRKGIASHDAAGSVRAFFSRPTRSGSRMIGYELQSQTDARKETQIAVAIHLLNRMLGLGHPDPIRIA